MLTLLVVTFNLINAQNDKIILRVDHFNAGLVVNESTIKWDGWESTSLRIIIEETNGKVIINNKVGSVFYLISLLGKSEKVDEDGDSYEIYRYESIDEEGIWCEIFFNVWLDLNLTQITVIYSDIAISYRCVAI